MKKAVLTESAVIKAKLDFIDRGYPKNKFYLDLFVDDKSPTVRKAVLKYARLEHLSVLIHDSDQDIREQAQAKFDAIMEKVRDKVKGGINHE